MRQPDGLDDVHGSTIFTAVGGSSREEKRVLNKTRMQGDRGYRDKAGEEDEIWVLGETGLSISRQIWLAAQVEVS